MDPESVCAAVPLNVTVEPVAVSAPLMELVQFPLTINSFVSVLAGP